MTQNQNSVFQERWQKMSFYLQLQNIGSELSRARNMKKIGNKAQERKSFERAIELIDFTTQVTASYERLRELLRLREAVASFLVGKELNISIDALYNYTFSFSLLNNL